MYFADRVGFYIGACIVALYDITPLPGETLLDPKKVEFSDTAFPCVHILMNLQLLTVMTAYLLD